MPASAEAGPCIWKNYKVKPNGRAEVKSRGYARPVCATEEGKLCRTEETRLWPRAKWQASVRRDCCCPAL
jgi:hypothetical protein